MKAADEIVNSISVCESESLRKLADNVKTSFMNIRILFRKYS